jgi:hypothetical protein
MTARTQRQGERRRHGRRGIFAGLAVALGLATASASASAAPGVSVGGKVDTSGAKGGAKGSGGGDGFELPERVVGGNAISALLPLQVGFAGYLPRVRIGFQYDRQIQKAHWIYLGVAVLLDRAGWQNFRLPGCGDGNFGCEKGTVAGFDIYGGYAHKFYLKDNPYLVPIVRAGLGGGRWWLPDITGAREQERVTTWTMNVRGGGGLRLFLTNDMALGLDVNLVIGFTRSKDVPLSMPATKVTNFLIGMEILPLLFEYRF